eukprot:XP_003728785.1 PREDICTED: acetylcholine receptor non-alpha chain-like [Strongylocentrotus purpuratus]
MPMSVSDWLGGHCRLSSFLFDGGYDITEIPLVGDDTPLPVTLHLTLQSIREVNEKEQSITGTSTLTVVWEDERLTWNPGKHSNLTVLTIPYRKVWTPSLSLFNTNVETSRIPPNPDDTKVHVRDDGQIRMETVFRHSTRCTMDLTLFPFDSQICKMIIASQDIITNVVLIPGVFIHRAEDRPLYWELTSLVAESRSRENRAGDHAVSDLLVIMHLERLPNHYIYTIILPVTLINAIGIWTFFIPLKSGERVTTCISVVLGVTVFQIVIIDVMPQTTRSGAIPPTIKYLTMTFITLAVIMMCSAMSLNITYQKRRIKNRFLRMLFFRILATMVFKRQEGLRKMTERNVQSAKSDGQDLNRSNNFSLCDETRDNTPQVIQSRENVSEENDMELVATIVDRIFLCTFLVIEICMIFMFRATFSNDA